MPRLASIEQPWRAVTDASVMTCFEILLTDAAFATGAATGAVTAAVGAGAFAATTGAGTGAMTSIGAGTGAMTGAGAIAGPCHTERHTMYHAAAKSRTASNASACMGTKAIHPCLTLDLSTRQM